MADRKNKVDWRRKQLNQAGKKYSKEEVLKRFSENMQKIAIFAPVDIVLSQLEPPNRGVSGSVIVSNSKKDMGSREKIPEWYCEDEDEDEDKKVFQDIEEEFSKVDVKYEEKVKGLTEEDEKIPEWDDYEEKEEEAEGEVIIYPSFLVKKFVSEGNPFASIILTNSTETEDSLATNPNSIPFEKVWYYKDPKGKIQGPFSTIDMFNWSAAGYFANNLQIAHSAPCHFFALQMYILQERCKGDAYNLTSD